MSICFTQQISIQKAYNKALAERINTFFDSNQSLAERVQQHENKNFIEAVEVDGRIYLSCYIHSKCDFDYIVLYEPGLYDTLCKTKHKAFAEDDYWSDFNRGFQQLSISKPAYEDFTGFGNGLVVLDSENLDIIKIYYFKDSYNMCDPVEILDVVDGNVVVRFSEFDYVFKNGEYTYLNFVNSHKHRCFGKYWINFPDMGYDQSCGWDLIDLSSHSIIPLTNIEPSGVTHNPNFEEDVEFDYLLGKFIFHWSKNIITSFSLSELISKANQ